MKDKESVTSPAEETKEKKEKENPLKRKITFQNGIGTPTILLIINRYLKTKIPAQVCVRGLSRAPFYFRKKKLMRGFLLLRWHHTYLLLQTYYIGQVDNLWKTKIPLGI